MLTLIELLLISIPVGFLGALTGLGGANILILILLTVSLAAAQWFLAPGVVGTFLSEP